MSRDAAGAAERVVFPAGGLRLYQHQQELWDARRVHGHRRRIANYHRQSGKDTVGLVDLLDGAIHHAGVYAYIGPTRQMIENICWHGVRATDGSEYLSVLPAPLLLDRNENDLALAVATLTPGKHSRVLFLSGNEPGRLRGLPLRGVVITEYAQFESSEVLDVVLPALNRSGGWVLILSTPAGATGHYADLWRTAGASADWWTSTKTIADTKDHDGQPLIDPGLIARELAAGQRQEWLEQEYHCKFVVGLVASIFGDLLNKAESEGRLLDLPLRTDRPTLVGVDLGVRDRSVAVFVQPHGEFLDLVDVWSGENLALPGVIQEIRARGWSITQWLAPHDLGQRDFSASGAGGTAVTRDTVARRLGVHFRIAPRLAIAEGLDAVRRMFSRFRFDRTRTAVLLEALGQYRRAWDAERRVFADRPLHDWCSDYADALRTFCVAYREPAESDGRPRQTSARSSLSMSPFRAPESSAPPIRWPQ